MSKLLLPFVVKVDEREITEPIARIEGLELKVEGRRAGKLPYLKGQNPRTMQPFYCFEIPLTEHTPWRETLEAIGGTTPYEIEGRYFGESYIRGRFCMGESTMLFTHLIPRTLYRVHYIGTGNGCNGMQASVGYYTGTQEDDTKVHSFSLQEILFIALLHNGIDITKIPSAIGKKMNLGASLDAPDEITDMEFIAFQFPEVEVRVTRNGQPYDDFLNPAQKRVLLEYLKK